MENVLRARRATLATWDGLTQRVALFLLRFARGWITFVLLVSDASMLLLAAALGVGARAILGRIAVTWPIFNGLALPRGFDPADYLGLVPLIAVFLGVYVWRGLIPAIGVSPVEELRRLSASTTIVALALASVAYITKSPTYYSRIAFGLAWVLALALVPLGRAMVRKVTSRAGLWGEPVAMIGYGPSGRWIADYLSTHPVLGLRPVVALNGMHDSESRAPAIPVIQVDSPLSLARAARMARVNTAIVVVPEVSEEILQDLVEPGHRGFERVITMSELTQAASLWVRPLDLGGVLALEVKQNLLSSWQQAVKRILDLSLIGLGAIVFVPLCILIAVLIRLESRGGAFYGSTRLGRGGKKFTMWKFRTMVPDAEQVLEHYLEQNPEMRAEWNESFKLRDDPRITRLGNILRKFSLDELPQLWNILVGEMSLVGPRPILVDEASRYDTTFRKYSYVLPGITGLWQTSGRNDSDYDLRVAMADYYVRNWSPWLDIYVLARTPWVVLRREGAY